MSIDSQSILQTYLMVQGSLAVNEIVKGLAGEIGKDGWKLGKNLLQQAVSFNERRRERVVARLSEAEQMAITSGQPTQEVPGAIIFRWCDYASLEEDTEQQRRWAALLANALVEPDQVLPGFVEILRELTSLQARILQWMYEMEERIDVLPARWPDVDRAALMETFKLDDERYALFIADLERLQLVEGRRDIPPHLGVSPEQMIDLIRGRWNSRVKYDQLGLTTLGIWFLRSCNPPKSTPDRHGPAE